MPEYIKIPKPFLVCDSCNEILIDSEGKVYRDSVWNEWGLVCAYHKMKGLKVFERYKEGDTIPKTHRLFRPMTIGIFGKDDDFP